MRRVGRGPWLSEVHPPWILMLLSALPLSPCSISLKFEPLFFWTHKKIELFLNICIHVWFDTSALDHIIICWFSFIRGILVIKYKLDGVWGKSFIRGMDRHWNRTPDICSLIQPNKILTPFICLHLASSNSFLSSSFTLSY